MFGTYRTFLALAVVAHHLLKIPAIGGHAVHAFFILSGFLMTTVMTKNYGYSAAGTARFAVNRFLRLFPSYWAILLLIIGSIHWWGAGAANAYHSAIAVPETYAGWLQNLTLIYLDPFPMEVFPRLAPPTWALTVELLFYLMIGLGLSRSRITTLCWFFSSVAYAISTHVLDLGFPYRYMHLLSGSLPFATGAMIFHFGSWIRERSLPYSSLPWIAGLVGLFIINSAVSALGKHLWHLEAVSSACLYLNLPINAALIAILINKPKLPVSARVDKFIGDFSYPVYLCHWQAGFVASMILFGRPERGPSVAGAATFLMALLICGLVSLATIHWIDRPIERLRSVIRARSAVSSPN
jgi:peptidoglycan/LPS O-acetylase OafA/YrhL